MTEAPAGQTRFYVRTGHATALALYAAVEQAFEDDGLPLGIYEVDEQRAIDEVSVYATQNAATIGRRLRRIVEEISQVFQSAKKSSLMSIGFRARSKG